MKALDQILDNKVVLAAEKPSRSICMLVHGRGGRHALMEWIAKRFQLPGLDYCCLQAPHEEFVPAMKVPGYSWFLRPDYQGLEESRAKLHSFITELIKMGYSADRIFWLGFSQGGIMGVDTAIRSDFQLGGVICVSGFVAQVDQYPEAFGPYAKTTKILATHGRRDDIVDFDRAKKSYDRLQELGVHLEFREYSKPHSFELKSEIPDLKETLKSWAGLS